jgi:hypothetical protein
MNKKIFWTTLILFALTLAACASIAGTTGTAPSGSSSADELPVQTKLILGTINLEETEYAVTADQATELLPMFHVLKDLNDSDTAAQEEIDGLVNQIQETLTADQTQAIEDMNLGRQDMMAVMQQNGTSGGSGSSQTGSTASAGGGGFAGGPPDMPGGGFPSGGMPSNVTTSTTRDTTSATQAMSGTPSALFDAVIKLLQKKIEG